MLKENMKQVNKIIATTLAWCSLVLIVLVFTDIVRIFNFPHLVRGTITIVGAMTTIVPYILLKLKVSDIFLKYYMLVALSILIGTLGTSNSLGIYITYVLVPIVSCLYFDKVFTLRMGIFSYIVMTIGVYVNAAGKMEVTYWHWSHLETFRDYMIGFTLEYVVVLMFVYQVVKRAQTFMETQYKSLEILQEENEHQKKITAIVAKGLPSDNMQALNKLTDDLETYTPENQAKLTAGHQFMVKMQNILVYGENANSSLNQVLGLLGEYFILERIWFVEIDPENASTKLSYQWYKDSCNEIKDYCSDMPVEVQNKVIELYDKNGYLEGNKNLPFGIDCDYSRYLNEKMLGTQLWIPAFKEGQYIGAMCFESGELKEFSVIDKFLLTEATGIVATQVERLNSDNANAAKSNFLSSMSHEIRTPMNAIMGMTTVALREDVNDNVRKCLNIIKSSSEGLLTIINDILDLSKIESGRIEIIEENYQIMSLLNDVSIMANARNAEKGLDIKYEYSSELPSKLFGDFVRIKQVMINLVTNSIKYTDEGTVTVRLSCENMDADNTLMRFEVTDTGQGIRDEDIDKLFSAYTQVNQEKNHHKEGTGLGLRISKQLIELMGGTIGVESTYGVGSTFYFEVPQRIKDSTPAGTLEHFEYDSQDDDEAINFTAPDARVLIVDDNKLNLVIEKALFRPLMMNITTASSGMEAIKLVKENEYDLIFMDHFMPEMDGVETVQVIRKLEGNPNQNIPIVALTADAISGVRDEMISAGMDDFLSKPIEMKAALRIFKTYLSK